MSNNVLTFKPRLKPPAPETPERSVGAGLRAQIEAGVQAALDLADHYIAVLNGMDGCPDLEDGGTLRPHSRPARVPMARRSSACVAESGSRGRGPSDQGAGSSGRAGFFGSRDRDPRSAAALGRPREHCGSAGRSAPRSRQGALMPTAIPPQSRHAAALERPSWPDTAKIRLERYQFRESKAFLQDNNIVKPASARPLHLMMRSTSWRN
jgi:hypothetical protein